MPAKKEQHCYFVKSIMPMLEDTADKDKSSTGVLPAEAKNDQVKKPIKPATKIKPGEAISKILDGSHFC